MGVGFLKDAGHHLGRAPHQQIADYSFGNQFMPPACGLRMLDLMQAFGWSTNICGAFLIL